VALLDAKTAKRTDRFTQIALVAADQAIADAGLSFGGSDRHDDVGVIVGTGIGGLNTVLANMEVMQQRGPKRVSALLVPMLMPNAPAGHISMRHGLHGIALALASACATSNNTIGEGAEYIRRYR
jgi:3-oxoacyl-[acyl-carrier-protein] synthase II